MLINDWMTRDVITVEPDVSMMKVSKIMKEKHIRRLPVVDAGKKLLGIVTDRDIKEASPSKATTLDIHELYYLLSEIKVKDIMTVKPFTVTPNNTIEKASLVMMEKRVGGLPVVDDQGVLWGVITQTDLFKATLYITGLRKGGLHVAVVLEDTPGSIMEIVNVVRQFGGRMASILSTYERAPAGYRNVYLRFHGIPQERIDDLLTILKEKAKLRYVVDHDQNRRTVFDTR